MDFLLRQDLRPVRFQLELLKPGAAARRGAHRIHFRLLRDRRAFPEPSKADTLVQNALTDSQRRSPSG
jgi:hypothetical protein